MGGVERLRSKLAAPFPQGAATGTAAAAGAGGNNNSRAHPPASFLPLLLGALPFAFPPVPPRPLSRPPPPSLSPAPSSAAPAASQRRQHPSGPERTLELPLSSGWAQDPCAWKDQVTCANGVVVGLDVSQQGFKGTLSPALGQLTTLTYLSVQTNSLTGPVPDSLGNLTLLRTLNLGDNQLSGPIPLSLSRLTNVQFFSLGTNKLTGTVPDFLTKLTSLRDIYFRQ